MSAQIAITVLDNGHKALMPVVTPRLTGHNVRDYPGTLGAQQQGVDHGSWRGRQRDGPLRWAYAFGRVGGADSDGSLGCNMVEYACRPRAGYLAWRRLCRASVAISSTIDIAAKDRRG